MLRDGATQYGLCAMRNGWLGLGGEFCPRPARNMVRKSAIELLPV
jgi:hypothetical protein